MSRKANRKSQKLFPFVKIIKTGGVLIHLKVIRCIINRETTFMTIFALATNTSKKGIYSKRKEFAQRRANSFL